ncbi:MAG: zinc ABC transporter substrate-binding protein [Rhodospirillales bacterium]|nr:zinc ABC transporter substrate-binding protein [Rhodospirillales bacterium]
MDCPRNVPRSIALALAAAALLGSEVAVPTAADDELRVVASIKPAHLLVSAVMAGVGEPHLIIRGHSSPHTFTMRPSDPEALEDADVVFMIGDTMETALAGPVDSSARHACVARLVDTLGLVRRPIHEGGAFEDHDHDSNGRAGQDDHDDHDDHADHDHSQGHEDNDDHADDREGQVPCDMHVWLDPINGWTMACTIGGVLHALVTVRRPGAACHSGRSACSGGASRTRI